MLIISHRGNVYGQGTINFALAVRRGWGVELDLRWSPEGPYFDHTPGGHTPMTDAKATLSLFGRRIVAVNIKEKGCEKETVALLQQYPDVFVFDMELCDVDPEAFKDLPRAVRMSDRIDERNVNKFEAKIVWLDEFQSWVEESDVQAIKAKGKLVYWVSPELHDPEISARRLLIRWRQLIDWGVDGICTDYPQILEVRLHD